MVVTLITYYIPKYTQYIYIYIYIYIKKRVLQPQEPSIKFCSLEFLRVLVPAPRLIFKDKSFSTRLTNLFIVRGGFIICASRGNKRRMWQYSA